MNKIAQLIISNSPALIKLPSSTLLDNNYNENLDEFALRESSSSAAAAAVVEKECVAAQSCFGRGSGKPAVFDFTGSHKTIKVKVKGTDIDAREFNKELVAFLDSVAVEQNCLINDLKWNVAYDANTKSHTLKVVKEEKVYLKPISLAPAQSNVQIAFISKPESLEPASIARNRIFDIFTGEKLDLNAYELQIMTGVMKIASSSTAEANKSIYYAIWKEKGKNKGNSFSTMKVDLEHELKAYKKVNQRQQPSSGSNPAANQ